MYEVVVTNKFTYGYDTFEADSLHKIKEKLKNYLFDDGSVVKLYEKKEMELDKDDYECINNRFIESDSIAKHLYIHSCVPKSWLNEEK